MEGWGGEAGYGLQAAPASLTLIGGSVVGCMLHSAAVKVQLQQALSTQQLL